MAAATRVLICFLLPRDDRFLSSDLFGAAHFSVAREHPSPSKERANRVQGKPLARKTREMKAIRTSTSLCSVQEREKERERGKIRAVFSGKL